MPYPRGRLFQNQRKVCEGGGGIHQQAQNFHAARVCQEFDLLKRLNGLNGFHFFGYQIRENLFESLS
jgi:hypothetical protein